MHKENLEHERVPEPTSVRLTECQKGYLEEKKKTGISQSFVIRQALDVWIASDNRGSKKKEKSR